jgi:hypothetical protein
VNVKENPAIITYDTGSSVTLEYSENGAVMESALVSEIQK